jgi:signal transduction histidine kinase
MNTCAVEARSPDLSVEPLAGPSSPVMTAAARPVPQGVRDERIDPADMDMLGTLGGMEQLRDSIEPDTPWQLGTRLAEAGGLDLLVEIAHDLRSPLTSILFLSETLHNGLSGDVNELQRRQLALIYSAALGLSGLVSNSIELASGGDRLADTEPGPFSIAQTLQSVQDMVRPMAEEKDLALHLRSEATDLRLGHSVALSRALLNLTCNALKFTERGFVEIAAVAKHAARVEFSVRDTGPGIDLQALSRLYQPFRRSWAGAGFTFSGSGLGLNISRKLIAAMGSELQVETAPDWGTRFYFDVDLPVAPSSIAALDLPAPSGPRAFEARLHLKPRCRTHPTSRSTARSANARGCFSALCRKSA